MVQHGRQQPPQLIQVTIAAQLLCAWYQNSLGEGQYLGGLAQVEGDVVIRAWAAQILCAVFNEVSKGQVQHCAEQLSRFYSCL